MDNLEKNSNLKIIGLFPIDSKLLANKKSNLVESI